MQTLRMYHGSINSRFIDDIINSLSDGGIIVAPVAGGNLLACDSGDTKAVERLARLAGCDLRHDPLTLYCADISQAGHVVRIDNDSFATLRGNAPGLRLELPLSGTVARPVKARRSVGITIADNDILQTIAETMGRPLLGITAEWDDSDLDPSQAEAVAEYYGSQHIAYTIVC